VGKGLWESDAGYEAPWGKQAMNGGTATNGRASSEEEECTAV